MPKFTFICDDGAVPFAGNVVTKRTFDFEAEDICDVITEFESFLKGCGYTFKGELVFHDYDDPASWENQEEDEEENNGAVMQHMVDSWPFPKAERKLCEICKLPEDVMITHQCWETDCPLKNNAN